MTAADASMITDLIRWARFAWHTGLIPRPVSIDETRLAQMERQLRAHESANVGGSSWNSRAQAGEWLTVADSEARYGIPRRTLNDWIRTGKVRSQRVGSGSRAPHLIATDDLERLTRRQTA